MLNPIEAVSISLKRYVDFKGRAPRSEFWWFLLFHWICLYVSRWLGQALELGNIIAGVVNLVLLLPLLSIQVRRLHDVGWSGWWVFWFYASALSVFILQASTDPSNASLLFLILGLVYIAIVLLFMLVVIVQYLRGSHPNGKKYGLSREDKSNPEAFSKKKFVPQPYMPTP